MVTTCAFMVSWLVPGQPLEQSLTFDLPLLFYTHFLEGGREGGREGRREGASERASEGGREGGREKEGRE